MIRTKRVYEQPSDEDGFRVLVDRLWPRGLAKEAARIDFWAKEIAPSDHLRKWFSHDPAKWDEFRRRYKRQLEGNEELWTLRTIVKEKGGVTLVYAAKDESRNNAVALKGVLQE